MSLSMGKLVKNEIAPFKAETPNFLHVIATWSSKRWLIYVRLNFSKVVVGSLLPKYTWRMHQLIWCEKYTNKLEFKWAYGVVCVKMHCVWCAFSLFWAGFIGIVTPHSFDPKSQSTFLKTEHTDCLPTQKIFAIFHSSTHNINNVWKKHDYMFCRLPSIIVLPSSETWLILYLTWLQSWRQKQFKSLGFVRIKSPNNKNK